MEELVGELLGELVLKLVVGIAEVVVLKFVHRLTRPPAVTAGME